MTQAPSANSAPLATLRNSRPQLALETQSVVWRGVAVRDLDQNASPEKRDKRVNKAVGKIFEHYSPKK